MKKVVKTSVFPPARLLLIFLAVAIVLTTIWLLADCQFSYAGEHNVIRHNDVGHNGVEGIWKGAGILSLLMIIFTGFYPIAKAFNFLPNSMIVFLGRGHMGAGLAATVLGIAHGIFFINRFSPGTGIFYIGTIALASMMMLSASGIILRIKKQKWVHLMHMSLSIVLIVTLLTLHQFF